MASEVGIINVALRKIGAEPIISLTDDSDNAAVADDLFDDMRDNLLRGHHWNFATKRKKLAQSSFEPEFEYDFKYPLPADFIRAHTVSDNDNGDRTVPYRIEFDPSTGGQSIYTNATDVWLKYVFRVTDANIMPPDFREALAYALAAEFAIAIAQSNTLYDRMKDSFRRAFAKARSVDGIEDYPDQFPHGTWITERFFDSNDDWDW